MGLQVDRVGEPRAKRRFILYVEGPRDRAILRSWAHRLLPGHGRRLFDGAVILGGRQPVRAIEHFRREEANDSGARGLCILDRDGGDGVAPDAQDGLGFFTWSRRHIESYLLVPAAIRRAVELPQDDHRLERVLEGHMPPAGDDAAWRDLDAKRLLAPGGALPRALGRTLPLARIARVTREPELHPDVLGLFDFVRGGMGLAS